MKSLLVGAGKTFISPPLDQSRRSGPQGLSTGIIGEFCARASVLQVGDYRIAIVLLDLCEFCRNITWGIRKLVYRYCGIPPEKIMVCATHTHAAPRILDEIYDKRDCSYESTDSYLDILQRQAASAVYIANMRLKPAKAFQGEISIAGIGRPSRIFLKNGDIVSLGSTVGIGDIPPDEIEAESLFDNTLRMVVFKDCNDIPICGLANFGCHNNIALHTTTLNSDFFGYAMSRMEEIIGETFVMSITAGTIGDVQPLAGINHKTFDKLTNTVFPPGRGDNMVARPGEILFRGLKEILKKAEPMAVDNIISVREKTFFPWVKPLSPLQLTYISAREKSGGGQNEIGGFAELQAIRIGEWVLMGICGEVFNEIGANLRKLSPFRYSWTISLANDMFIYLMPSWEQEREKVSERKSYQYSNCITGEEVEGTIYNTYKKLFISLLKERDGES